MGSDETVTRAASIRINALAVDGRMLKRGSNTAVIVPLLCRYFKPPFAASLPR